MAIREIYLFDGILLAIGIGLIYFGFNRLHNYLLIKDIPRSKIRSIAMGIVEIHGRVKAKDLIYTPFSKTPCVYYRYEIRELRQNSSSKGSHSSWDLIGTGENRIPFFAEDDTGSILVDPAGAEIKIPLKKLFFQRGNFLSVNDYFDLFKITINSNGNKDLIEKFQRKFNENSNLTLIDPKNEKVFFAKTGDRKYYEYYLEPNENLFVIGTATPNNYAPGGIQISKGENEKSFIISNKDERQMLNSMRNASLVYLFLGSILTIGAIILLLSLIGIF